MANGIVYAPSSTLQAFDANGVTNCSGTPRTCAPLWSYNVDVMGSSPSVANGLVYIGSASLAHKAAVFGVMAFDASGRTHCSGTPAVCNPLWTGPTGAPLTGSPAVANGKVYVTDNSFGLGFRNRPLRVGAAPADDRCYHCRPTAPRCQARKGSTPVPRLG